MKTARRDACVCLYLKLLISMSDFAMPHVLHHQYLWFQYGYWSPHHLLCVLPPPSHLPQTYSALAPSSYLAGGKQQEQLRCVFGTTLNQRWYLKRPYQRSEICKDLGYESVTGKKLENSSTSTWDFPLSQINQNSLTDLYDSEKRFREILEPRSNCCSYNSSLVVEHSIGLISPMRVSE